MKSSEKLAGFEFLDASGETRRLGDYWRDRPVALPHALVEEVRVLEQ